MGWDVVRYHGWLRHGGYPELAPPGRSFPRTKRKSELRTYDAESATKVDIIDQYINRCPHGSINIVKAWGDIYFDIPKINRVARY